MRQINKLLQREDWQSFSILDLDGFGSEKMFMIDGSTNKSLTLDRTKDIVNFLEQYLKNRKVFSTDNREIIINLINYKVNGFVVKSARKLNEYLLNNNIPYQIEQFKKDIKVKGKLKKNHSFWRIVKQNNK